MKKLLLLLISALILVTCSLLISCSDEPTTYTVTFDSDGGSAVEPQKVEEGNKATEPTAPTKNGYNFDGWYFGKDAWRFSLDNMTSDITLKAKWTPIQYSAKFYADGNLVDTVTFTCEDNELSRVPSVPNKNGYSATWEGYTLGLQDVTVNAVYTKVTYTITYNDENGIEHSNPTSYNVETDTITLASLSMTGKIFDGWYDSNNVKVTSIPKGSYGNIVLTAKWTNKANVTFDSDGGSDVSSQLLTPGSKITEPTAPTKAGYEFAGWLYKGEPWRFNLDTVTESITLKAKWTPIQYSAKFYADGNLVDTVTFTCEDNELSRVPSVPNKNGYNGDWENFTIGLQNIRVDATYSIITYTITYNNLNGATNNNSSTYTVESDTIVLKNLEVPGFVFKGWIDENGNPITSIPKGTYGNLNLTANWEGMLSIIFDANGGSAIPSQLLASGSKVTEPTAPTKTGYEFDGWFYNGEPWRFNLDTVTENISLKAKWTPIQYNAKFYVDGELVDTVSFTCEDDELSRVPNVPNKNGYTCAWENYTLSLRDVNVNAIFTKISYTITYNDENGIAHSNPTSYNVETDTITLASISCEGKIFDGWYNANGVKITHIPKGSYGNIILTARWTNRINITFNSDGGSSVNSQQFDPNSKIIEPTKPTKTGYTFDGWFYNGEPWRFNIDTVTTNIELKAKWTPIQYSAKFYADGILIDTVTFTCEDNELSRIPNIPAKNGYNSKWNLAEDYTITAADMRIDAIYSIITYTISYSGLNESKHTNPIEYNIESQTIVLLNPQDRTGYTFDGWFVDNKPVTSILNGSHGDISICAKWSPIRYYITYTNLNGATNNNPTYYTIEDQNITLSDPVLQGYTFDGWVDLNGNILTTIDTSKLSSITLTAIWSAYKFSTKTNTENAGEYTIHTNEYTTSGTDVVLTATPYIGYNFIGWYHNNELVSSDSTFKFTMPHHDITYTVKFEPKPELNGYIFTSTATSCTITGVEFDTTNITELTIPEFVTHINHSFSFPNLVSLTIGNKTQELQFSLHAPKLTNINLPDTWLHISNNAFTNTAYYKNSDNWENGALYIGKHLIATTSDLPAEYTIKSGTISVAINAFYGQTNLKKIIMPSSLKDVGESAFYGCSNLESVELSALRHIRGGTFAKCTSLKSIVIPEGPWAVTSGAFSGCTSLEYVSLPSTCRELRQSVFSGCKSLKSINLPVALTSIGNQAFYNCSALENIYYEGTEEQWEKIVKGNQWDTGTGSYILNFIIPGINYTLVDNAYYSVSYYPIPLETSVYIPQTYQGLPVKVLADNAFKNCTNLVSITLPEGITQIGSSAFYNCTNLVTINIPDTVVDIGEYAFYNCTSIKHIKLSKVDHIRGYTFYNCTSLETIEIPEGITAVTGYAFSGCESLKSIVLPSTCNLIRPEAFKNCTSLTSITILGEITEICRQAFENCTKLENIYYYGTQTQWESILKGDNWDNNTGNYTITYNYTGD